MGKSPCCDKDGVKKGPWTPEEDHKLTSYIHHHGHGSWTALPLKAGLQRCGKSCRLRWINYLRPDIKRGKFSLQEEQTIIQLHALLGNRWSAIASHLPKRTDNEIKNYWNTYIKKKLCKMGIDPVTHKPKNRGLIGCGQPKDIANLNHMAQWESARLEAEARIVRESKAQSNSYNSISLNKPMTQPQPSLPRPPCLDILKAWQATKSGSETITIETLTSIFDFSDSMLVWAINPLIHDNSLASMKYAGINPSTACMDKPHQGNQCKVIHDNIVDTIRTTFSADHGDESFLTRLPSFLEGFTDLAPEAPPSISATASAQVHAEEEGGVYEDNKMSYWSDILNAENSCMDAFVF